MRWLNVSTTQLLLVTIPKEPGTILATNLELNLIFAHAKWHKLLQIHRDCTQLMLQRMQYVMGRLSRYTNWAAKRAYL